MKAKWRHRDTVSLLGLERAKEGLLLALRAFLLLESALGLEVDSWELHIDLVTAATFCGATAHIRERKR